MCSNKVLCSNKVSDAAGTDKPFNPQELIHPGKRVSGNRATRFRGNQKPPLVDYAKI